MPRQSSHSSGHYRYRRSLLAALLLAAACGQRTETIATSAIERQRELREAEKETFIELGPGVDANLRDPGTGELLSIEPDALRRAVLACPSSARSIIRYRVSLNTAGEPVAVELTQDSGVSGCDEAILAALFLSRWRPCLEGNAPEACELETAIYLPPEHRPSHGSNRSPAAAAI